MFESALLPVLQNDATLSALVDMFKGRPAVFSDMAPESAPKRYVLFTIARAASGADPVQTFKINVDYFDHDVSGVDGRAAAGRIEMLLDGLQIDHARYSKIRIKFFSGGPVPETDPRAIHQNLTFQARAGRIEYCEKMTTLEE